VRDPIAWAGNQGSNSFLRQMIAAPGDMAEIPVDSVDNNPMPDPASLACVLQPETC
jgi:hypothetical protein